YSGPTDKLLNYYSTNTSENTSLSSIHNEVLTGLLLSDEMLIKRNKGNKAGAYFSLTQTCNPNNEYVLGHVELLFYTFNLFSNYINNIVPSSNWARTKN